MSSDEKITAYVDGSYSDALKRYSFGCVFITPYGCIYTACGYGDNPDSLKSRNVTGEMLGAMYAVQCARKSGYKAIDIYYDYAGIEMWVTGAWKRKNDLTVKYAMAMCEWGRDIDISFHKVDAHTGVEYNEMADRLARKGLESDGGIPPVKKIDDLELWQ